MPRLVSKREAQLGLLRAVALELVASPRFRHLLDALVPELLAHGTIGGRRAAAILKTADAMEGR